MSSSTFSAPYDRRRAAGLASREDSRARLLRAADELFREQGYLATTVSAIAERAGTSLQTLYLAWGSKSALFRAGADAAATASGLPLTADAWHQAISERLTREAGADATTERYLTAVAHVFVEVAARTAVYWAMQPGAASADPEIAVGYTASMNQRRITMDGVARATPADNLRRDLSPESIADTVYSLASPEMFALFTRQAHRTAAEYEQWLSSTLISALTTELPAPQVEEQPRVTARE